MYVQNTKSLSLALEGRDRRFLQVKASLVYKVSFRTAQTTQRKCVLKNQTNKNKKT